MIKKIIACSDIHIRNFKHLSEYQAQLQKFIDECKNITSQYKEGEVRIVVAGDLLHNKLDISSEAYLMCTWFLKELDSIAITYVIAGNHDVNMANLSRVDPLTTIFNMYKFNRVFYLDKEFDYQSGYKEDSNVVFCLYSTFDEFRQPDIKEYKLNNKKKTYIGLFHGEIKSAKTDVGYSSERGFTGNYFEDIDFGICGHIHKRQMIKCDGIPMVYCGSLIQQDFGENITKHGYIVLDVKTLEYEEFDIENSEFGMYEFTITNFEDIKNNKEELTNF